MKTENIILVNGQTVSINNVDGYSINAHGVCSDNDPSELYASLCWVDASICSLVNNEIQMVVKGVNSYTQEVFELRVPSSDFISDYKQPLIKRLMDNGTKISYGKQKEVMTYLASQEPREHIVAVTKIGWHKGIDGKHVYARPNRVIGETVPPITLLKSDESVAHKAIFTNGTLKDEKQYVSDLCSGNYLLVFARGIAYASLMMKLLAMEGGGFHFYGHSSRGKTTLLQLIAAVVGCGSDPGRHSDNHYIQSWDATDYALELTAQSFNSCPLLLDELHKYHGAHLASLVYTLAGGKGKARGQANLTLRKTNEWLNMLVSTGEHSIPAAIAKSGARKVTTGQQIRILDILVEDNIFTNLHGMEQREFVETIKENCAQYHGVSGELFTTHLVELANDEVMLNELKQRYRTMTKALEREDMSAEQARVLAKFAAVQLGLYMAIEQELVNFTVQEVDGAVNLVLDGWLACTSTLSDIDQGIANIATFILTQPGRFRAAADASDNKSNIVGYRDISRGLYLIIPEKFEEVCGKSHKREILKSLMTKGLLALNNTDGKGGYRASSRHRVSGIPGQGNFYAIRDKILSDDTEADKAKVTYADNVIVGAFK